MPDQALELSFAEADERAIREQWSALREAGLPSQAEHRSMTNAPHLTLVAARQIPEPVVRVAAERTSVPTELTVRGLVIFGEGSRVTLAHLVEPSPGLAQVVAELRAGVPELRHPVWTPHVTLARRVPRTRVADAVAVLTGCPPIRSLTANRLRWWDPAHGSIEELVPG